MLTELLILWNNRFTIQQHTLTNISTVALPISSLCPIKLTGKTLCKMHLLYNPYDLLDMNTNNRQLSAPVDLDLFQLFFTLCERRDFHFSICHMAITMSPGNK